MAGLLTARSKRRRFVHTEKSHINFITGTVRYSEKYNLLMVLPKESSWADKLFPNTDQKRNRRNVVVVT